MAPAPSSEASAVPEDVPAAVPNPDETRWPDEAAESAMGAELRVRDAGPAVTAPSPAGGAANLPPMDTLIAQISAETRAVLDELFRAKFTTVRRVPESALKT